MANSYNSSFTGAHNDEYNDRITTLENKAAVLENKTQHFEENGSYYSGGNPWIYNGSSGVQLKSDGAIELYHNSMPYIDFHYANSTDDYSARLYCTGTNNLSIGNSRLHSDFVNSTFWINTRIATFNSTTSSSGSGAKGHISLKSRSGCWTICDYNTEALYFCYGTDANYNAGANSVVTARITSAGAFTNASKRELKENIELVDYSCLDIINSIRICSFNMKGDPEKAYRVGFIADDTDPIISGKEQDVMDIQNCIGVLIKAVQELSDKVRDLENKLKEFSN